MRGIKGSGLGGMRMASPSPADENVMLMRPLLETRRAEIVAYAKERGLSWREDSSNRELHAERNRVRNVILPALRAKERDIDATLLQQIRALQEQADASRTLARAWLLDGAIPFADLSAAMQREVIVAQLHDRKLPATAAGLNELLTTGSASLNASNAVRIGSDGKVRIINARDEGEIRIDLTRAGSVRCFGFEVIWGATEAADKSAVAGEFVFDADCVGNAAILRRPQPGDRIQLSGRGSARPIAEMLSRNKVPRAERDQAVVAAAASGEIFWASPLRITEGFKIREETKRFLVWRWRRT